jgi:hypothetical protein
VRQRDPHLLTLPRSLRRSLLQRGVQRFSVGRSSDWRHDYVFEGGSGFPYEASRITVVFGDNTSSSGIGHTTLIVDDVSEDESYG